MFGSLLSNIKSTASSLMGEVEASEQSFRSDIATEEKRLKLWRQRQQMLARKEGYPLWKVWVEDKSILEAEAKRRIQALAADERTFTVAAPPDDAAGFAFDLEFVLPFALLALKLDPALERARHKLTAKRYVSAHASGGPRSLPRCLWPP
jgi:hypothetical protein